MARIETPRRSEIPSLCLIAACLIVPLGCGSSDESHLLSAARGVIADLGGGFTAGSDEPGAEPAARLAGETTAGDAAQEPAAATQHVIIEGGEASEVAESEEDAAESAMYSYFDGNGGAHMVRGLHHVPAPYRGRARNLSEGGGPVINRYESKAVPVSRRVVFATQPGYNPNRSNIILYSADWCGACKKAKRLLDGEGVSYEVRDIDANPDAKDEVRSILGAVRIPLLDIDGTYVSGYQPEQIKRLLSRS